MTDVLELLGKHEVREILAAATEPQSTQDLSETCDVPLTTTYRYVNELLDHDLLEAESKVDPDGYHYTVYSTRFRGCYFYLADGSIETKLVRNDDPDADEMISFETIERTISESEPT